VAGNTVIKATIKSVNAIATIRASAVIRDNTALVCFLDTSMELLHVHESCIEVYNRNEKFGVSQHH
jgi:hypothetical protein